MSGDGSEPTHRLWLVGCDDATPVDVALTELELALMKELCQRSLEAAGGPCMPRMKLVELPDEAGKPHWSDLMEWTG